MTNKELSQLYYLNREIKGLEELIEEMESRAECITPNLTGMPHGSGVSDKIGFGGGTDRHACAVG